MRLVVVVVLSLLFGIYVGAKADNTQQLKIDSCGILYKALEQKMNETYDKAKILPYVEQYIINCTKPIEYDILDEVKVQPLR